MGAPVNSWRSVWAGPVTRPSPHPRRHLPPPPLGPIQKILLYSILIYSFSTHILLQKCLQVDARRGSCLTRQRHLASKTRPEDAGGGKFSGTPAGCCGAFSCVPSAPSSANDGAGHSRSITCVYGSHSACTVTHPSTTPLGDGLRGCQHRRNKRVCRRCGGCGFICGLCIRGPAATEARQRYYLHVPLLTEWWRFDGSGVTAATATAMVKVVVVVVVSVPWCCRKEEELVHPAEGRSWRGRDAMNSQIRPRCNSVHGCSSHGAPHYQITPHITLGKTYSKAVCAQHFPFLTVPTTALLLPPTAGHPAP